MHKYIENNLVFVRQKRFVNLNICFFQIHSPGIRSNKNLENQKENCFSVVFSRSSFYLFYFEQCRDLKKQLKLSLKTNLGLTVHCLFIYVIQVYKLIEESYFVCKLQICLFEFTIIILHCFGLCNHVIVVFF